MQGKGELVVPHSSGIVESLLSTDPHPFHLCTSGEGDSSESQVIFPDKNQFCVPGEVGGYLPVHTRAKRTQSGKSEELYNECRTQ